MKRFLVFVLLALLTFDATQAQYPVRPAEPNEECMKAWNDYQKADRLWKTGWGLFGAGLGVGVIGGIMYPLAAFGNSSSPTGNPAARAAGIASLTFLCVGSGMIVASVPCLAVGQVRRKAARKAYNENCVPAQPVVSFYLQSSSNGLGLAMLF